MTEMHLKPEPPYSDDMIRANVRNAISLGFPDINPSPGDKGIIHLYANGPSAFDEPPQYPCMVLNGALRAWPHNAEPPNFWAACDPAAHVADFLDRYVPPETKYLVASKCHPDVFNALTQHKNRRAVILWHVLDATQFEVTGKSLIPSATTITICALFLLQWIGFTEIIVHGWDGAYGFHGQSHAAPQPHNSAEDVAVTFGDASFHTTYPWIAEMHDAAKAIEMGLISAKVRIKGDGMMATVLGPLFNPLPIPVTLT